MDPADSRAAHRQVLRQRGLRVLENLVLDAVPGATTGAPPLKLTTAMFSPVRPCCGRWREDYKFQAIYGSRVTHKAPVANKTIHAEAGYQSMPAACRPRRAFSGLQGETGLETVVRQLPGMAAP